MTRVGLVLTALALALVASSCGSQQTDPIRIGVLADCEGFAAGFYDVSLAGAELPLLERGATLGEDGPRAGVRRATAGGRPLELVLGCAGERTDAAVELRRLVESAGAQIVIGPSVIPLGLVVAEYARTRQEVTFLVTSQEEVLGYLAPGENVFRFTLDYAQTLAGLGSYAYRELGWRRAATIAPGDPIGWGWSAGPIAEFCSLGGSVADRIWLDGTPGQLPAVLAELPVAGVDGYFLLTNGAEAGPILERLAQSERELGRHVVASPAAITGLDPAVVARIGSRLDGILIASDIAGPGLPSFDAYAESFAQAFPALNEPASANFHLFDIPYANAMSAVVLALDAAGGELSDGQRRFRSELGRLELDTATGPVRLDGSRQAVGTVFRFRVGQGAAGALAYEPIEPVGAVEASFGGHLGSQEQPSRRTPTCESGSPPAWTSE